jgi:hypothetical protein
MLFTHAGLVAPLRSVMADRLSSILEGFRLALRREQLPAPSPPRPRDQDAPGLLQAVFARETLPLDPPLPVTPRRGFLSLLIGREPLGHAAPGPAPHRARWLTWLFRPEHLDDG